MLTPSKSGPVNQITQPDIYVVYGWQRSYFTHKLLAALHFYGAPYEFRDKTKDNSTEIRLRSGTHQIPVLHTPENWMIGDTTPILRMLDGRYPERALFPSGVMGTVVQILEEFFDEWLPRTAVHWRWNYPENHELLAMDIARGDRTIADKMILWGNKVCKATGVASDIQMKAVEDEYDRVLTAAEDQLSKTRYLLGNRPTAVDCIVLAGLRAHFLYDPAPKRAYYDKYPAIVRWTEEEADKWDGDGTLPGIDHLTDFAKFILSEMATTYLPFALGNAAALAKGERSFVIEMYGEEVSYLARPYVEQSRQMVIDQIKNRLSVDQQQALTQLLSRYQLQTLASDDSF